VLPFGNTKNNKEEGRYLCHQMESTRCVCERQDKTEISFLDSVNQKIRYEIEKHKIFRSNRENREETKTTIWTMTTIERTSVCKQCIPSNYSLCPNYLNN